MLHDDVHLISVNGHIVEPGRVFGDRLAAKWQAAAPTVIEQPVIITLAILDAAIAEGNARVVLRLPRT